MFEIIDISNYHWRSPTFHGWVRQHGVDMTAYLILTVGSLMFWSLYQMAPSGLMLFAVNNVNLMIGAVKIQPQWIQNINTICIVLGGPILAALFTRMRVRGWRIDIPKQFAASLLLMAVAFLILPLGIKLAGADGKSAFVWLFMRSFLWSSFRTSRVSNNICPAIILLHLYWQRVSPRWESVIGNRIRNS